MKRIFLNFAFLLFSLILPPPLEVKAEETTTETEIGTYSAVGLLAVGGAGSIIIAQNLKKKKDEPSSEIKKEDRDPREFE